MSDIQEEIEYEQHCNEQLRNKITNLEYKIERLEEENTKLKELCDKYEEEHSTTFEEWKKDIKTNKKAIEYIEYEMPCLWEVDEIFEDMDGKDYNTWKEYDENILLNLLNGSDKE